MPAIDERRIRGEQLDRRYHDMITLANPFASRAIGGFRNMVRFGSYDSCVIAGFARPQSAGNFLIRNAGSLAKIKFAQSGNQTVPAQPLAQRREVVVARVGDGLRWRERRQVISVHARQRKTQSREPPPTSCARVFLDPSGAPGRER